MPQAPLLSTASGATMGQERCELCVPPEGRRRMRRVPGPRDFCLRRLSARPGLEPDVPRAGSQRPDVLLIGLT